MSEIAVIGQYWSGESFVHRMDPRAKMLLSLLVVAVVFCAQSYAALAVCALFIGGFYLASEIPLSQALRSVAPLLFLVLLTALLNVLFVRGGEIYFQWWIICVSQKGLVSAAFIAVRLFLLLLGMSLLTLTTAALDITEAFERLLSPFARIGLPAHELGMLMGIALRFLPQFVTELRCVYRAQVSRGASFSANPLRGGMRSLTALLVPLFASAFRHAETLSGAMDARCYHGGNGRTRLSPLRFSSRDGVGCAAVLAMFACVLAVNVLL